MNFNVKATMLSVAILFFSAICPAQNFAPATNYPTGSLPDGSAAADFNHDGNVDIIVANEGDTTLSLFSGNGDGTLRPAGTIQIGYRPISVATGDFNGDGNIDVAVCGIPTSPIFTILFGNGDGTFQAPVNVTIPSSM